MYLLLKLAFSLMKILKELLIVILKKQEILQKNYLVELFSCIFYRKKAGWGVLLIQQNGNKVKNNFY